MTRHVLCHENSEVIPGTFLAPGSLKLPNHPIAVVWPHMAPRQPIGTAKDFERDDATGAISFEIGLFHGEVVDKDELFIYATDLVARLTQDREAKHIQVVSEATIREICYAPRPANPRSRLTTSPETVQS